MLLAAAVKNAALRTVANPHAKNGVAKEDFVRMYADPFCTQSPRNESSNRRGEHSDNNQINTAADLECTRVKTH